MLKFLPEFWIALDFFHVYLGDLVCSRVASQEVRNTRVGFHNAQQGVSSFRVGKVELLGNHTEARSGAKLLLILNDKKGDAKEGTVEFVEGLAFLGLSEDFIIEFRYQKGL